MGLLDLYGKDLNGINFFNQYPLVKLFAVVQPFNEAVFDSAYFLFPYGLLNSENFLFHLPELFVIETSSCNFVKRIV